MCVCVCVFCVQASSLHLEQTTKELESKLQQAYTRMENGEPPDDKALAEWERMLQDENRRKQSLMEKMNVRQHVPRTTKISMPFLCVCLFVCLA